MSKKTISLILCVVMCLSFVPVTALAAEPVAITSIDFTLTGYTYGSPIDEAVFTCSTPGVTIVAANWSIMGNFGSTVPASGNFLARDYACSLYIKNDDGYVFDNSLTTDKITVNGKAFSKRVYFDLVNINTAPGSTRRFLAYYPALPSPCSEHSFGEWEKGNGTHYSSCLVCGYRKSSPCKYGELEVITPATVSTEGCEAIPCTVCGYIKYQSEKTIPKLGYIMTESDKYGFTGSPITPPVKAYDVDGLEIPGDFYEVTYNNNEGIGTATATATFSGKYSGVLTADYEIVAAKTLEPEKFSLEYSEAYYDGTAKTPAVISEGYTDGTDFSVEYINNISPGVASAVITGKGEYVGTVTKSFSIKKAVIGKIDFSVENFVYGQPLDNVIVTTDTSGINIVKTVWLIRANNGSSVEASGNITCEEYSMSVFLSVDPSYKYAESLATDKNFTLTGAEISSKDKTYFDLINTDKVPGSDHRFYVYLKQLPSPCTVHSFGPYDELPGGTTHSCRCVNCGYRVFQYHSYGEEFEADETNHWKECSVCGYRKESTPHSGGTATCTSKAVCSVCKTGYGAPLGHTNKTTTVKATLTKSGKIETTCSVCGDVSETTTIYSPKTFTLSATSFTYTGKEIKPTVTVKDSNGKVVSSSNYTVSYSGNVNAGTGKVTIKFKGNYSGTKTVNFTITPKLVTGLKVSDEKTTSLKLSWSKTAGAKYYKVEQSTDGKKWKTVTTTDKTSYTVKSLKAGTKYQFRVTALDSTKKIAGKASSVLKTGTLTSAPTLTLKSTKSKTATASWKKVTGASKYVVYKSTNGKKWTKVTTTTKTSYNLTKLTGGKKIYVKVTALNAYGEASSYSSTKNVTVKK